MNTSLGLLAIVLQLLHATSLRITPALIDETHHRQCIGNARRTTSVSNVAFVTGGMGEYSSEPKSAKMLAFAETLGRIGGWAGSIYILTDKLPSKDLEDRMRKPEIVGKAQVNFIQINPERGGVDFGKGDAGGGGGYLKSMMFDQPSISEDILIWHDADKVVGQTECLVDIFAHDGAKLSEMFNGSASILVGNDAEGGQCFRDASERCGDRIHLGTLAAHRHQSAPLLQAWARRTQREPATLDRYTFYDALKEDEPSTGMIKLPDLFLDHMWNVGETGCVNHITNGRLYYAENRQGLPALLSSLCLQSVSDDIVHKAYGVEPQSSN